MKKLISVVLICMLSMVLPACAEKQAQPREEQWEISVSCITDPDPEAYVITYGDVTVSSETGILTLQNRNDFDIAVHLSCDGQEEKVFEIQQGGVLAFHQAVKGAEYTVGLHADVKEGTEIKLMVYDGERAEVHK
ncbi:MAG: hypothetical protein IKU32_01660 [Clostridia bacterium]|nr:hypothetical protein [Clostridia bacterium]